MRQGRGAQRAGLGARAAFLGLAVLLPSVPAAADVAYTVKIDGAGDDSVGDTLRGSSDLVRLTDQKPATLTALARRAQRDVDRLAEVLKAFGYFDGQVVPRIDATKDLVAVELAIDRGPAYPVTAFSVTGPDGAPLPADLEVDPTKLGIETGKPYRAADVEAATRALLSRLGEKAHPFAQVTQRKVVADRAAKRVSIAFVADPGPAARFGPVTIEGLEKIDPELVRNVLPFKEGDPATDPKLTETRRLLYRTSLFRTVELTLQPPGADGLAPVSLKVEEAKLRSFGGGIRYDTSEGIGANVFWEHRNLFGNRERFRATADLAQNRRGLDFRLTRPDFLTLDQDVVLDASAAEETFDAYRSRKLAASGGLERRLRIYTLRGGLSYEHNRITDAFGSRTFDLVGVPLGVRRDTTDDLLDPTEGTRIDLSLTPYLDVGGRTGPFTPMILSASGYLQVSSAPRVVLALRGALGTIQGPANSEIPADKRFYAGGGDSVRGFGYQRAGPLDASDNPVGGRAIAVVGGEARINVTPEIGVVPFVDVGTVNQGPVPDFADGVFMGAGIGLRYNTGVGPLRIDVATPVMGKRASDDPIQLYLSLGQAF
jgi:translocation and assembly module TamA